jgi:hypothetical protein
MSSAALIRAQVEARLSDRVPAAFRQHTRPEVPVIRTGMSALDSQIGGIPCGAITELVSPARVSSGHTSLQTQLLASAAKERFCALIDATDSFDPKSAQAAGMNLKRLLWIRCSNNGMKALEQAFRCADLLIQGSSGFGLILVDVSAIPERFVRKIPLTTWFRFSRVIERLETTLVFSTPCPVISTCSALSLSLSPANLQWSQTEENGASHTRLFAGLNFAAEITRKRSFRKPVQSAVPMSAYPKWA